MKPLPCKERDKWMYSFGFDLKIYKAVTEYLTSFFGRATTADIVQKNNGLSREMLDFV